MPAESRNLSFASRAIHADDGISSHRAVAPAMHVSTTFRYNSDPDELDPKAPNGDRSIPEDSHVYSRESNPNSARLEAVLSSLLQGPSLTYSSGLAAFHAMMVHLNPKRIAITGGYHGCHGVINIMSRLTGLQSIPLEGDLSELEAGDVIHVETPLNPTGEARNLAHYAAKAREVGAWLTVDATFAPPPLMSPFDFGVDIVMNSGTKYVGGHSDMLCGVLTLAPKHEEKCLNKLADDRTYLGSMMGSFEGWLGLRSSRTLELRVRQQSSNAMGLVSWLSDQLHDKDSPIGRTVERIQHSSLQREASEEGSWLQKQMPNGHGPVFAMIMKTEEMARRLPSKLHLFHHATSLGGVESLIEWRAMSDQTVDRRLMRVSIGIENVEDMKQDLLQAFEQLAGS